MFKILRLAASFLCGAALLLFSAASGVKPVFASGEEYTFYCGSSSSQAEIVVCPPEYAAAYKYFLSDCLTGESTVYRNKVAAEIMETYKAELLFTETVCGTVNYYCYAQQLGAGVFIGGYSVNLHIAEGDNRTTVGTPIIFGGF